MCRSGPSEGAVIGKQLGIQRPQPAPSSTKCYADLTAGTSMQHRESGRTTDKALQLEPPKTRKSE